jgi:hypothetical protein
MSILLKSLTGYDPVSNNRQYAESLGAVGYTPWLDSTGFSDGVDFYYTASEAAEMVAKGWRVYMLTLEAVDAVKSLTEEWRWDLIKEATQ